MTAARALCVVAGAADLGTGVALLAAPALVLGVLGAPAVVDAIAWRWIGVFVAAVGAAYLYPFVLRRRRAPRLPAVVEVTALARIAVALFVGTQILAGALPAGWWLVAGTDAGLAAAQLALHARGDFDDGP